MQTRAMPRRCHRRIAGDPVTWRVVAEDQDYDGVDLSVEQLEPDDDHDSVEVENQGDDSEGGDFEHLRPPDRRLITQPYDLAISDLVNQVGHHNLHLSPVYQRKYVWDNKKASKLVESLLINVPIPVCYLAEESDGTRSVIDGQQPCGRFTGSSRTNSR